LELPLTDPIGETMKNQIISGAVTIVLGLLIAFGPQFIFKVCNVTEESVPLCHWSAQAEIGMGMILVALGGCFLVFAEQKTRFGLTIGVFLISIIVLFIPHALIGGCSMMSMACRRVAFPALSVISILLLMGSMANMFFLEGKTQKDNQHKME
jgi:uncharacterized integral membrane protein